MFELQLKVEQQSELSELMFAKHVTGRKEIFEITKSPEGSLKIAPSSDEIRNPAEKISEMEKSFQNERMEWEAKGIFHHIVLICLFRYCFY